MSVIASKRDMFTIFNKKAENPLFCSIFSTMTSYRSFAGNGGVQDDQPDGPETPEAGQTAGCDRCGRRQRMSSLLDIFTGNSAIFMLDVQYFRHCTRHADIVPAGPSPRMPPAGAITKKAPSEGGLSFQLRSFVSQFLFNPRARKRPRQF